MEAALGIASLVVVLVVCAAGIAAVSLQVRCVDAAREAARLAARGQWNASGWAGSLAPAGASVDIRREGSYVIARVAGRSALLPGLVVSGQAVAAVEPGQR